MRKYLILLIVLCLQMAARGQTITSLDDLDLSGLPQPTTAKALRYWFDDDDGSMMTASGLSGNHSIDVSGLIEGLHTLHYQVIASDDGVAYVSSTVFLKIEHGTSATARSLRYWFDDDNVKTATGTSGTYVLDASLLIEGLHTLHYQVTDNNDVLAYVGSCLFLKMNGKSDAATLKSLRYWFDDDNDNVKTITSGGVQTLDVSALLDGLHAIHYQVTSSDGMAAYVASALFLKTGSSFEAENVKAQKLMYWFDDEIVMQQADISEGVQLVDASVLTEGLHTLHYQVLCNNGQMTPTMSTIFLRVSANAETVVAKNLRYWFDDEQSATETEITDGVQLLNASALIEGLHTVHYQIEDSNGTLGAPYSSIFLKMNWDTSTTTAKALRYWYDDELTATETAIANGTQTLDAARLIDGLHTVHYQIVDSKGTPGAPYSSVFLKMDTSASTVAKSLRYWFDDDASTVSTTSVAGGTQTLDVSGLPTGLHTLNYQLIDSKGRVTTPVTRLFMKNFDKVLADGHNHVTKYQYWLNTNSQAMQTVELASADNPYTLISLLPMQKEPIQSSQFHFEITNDMPTIYAKNTLHVRFYDAQNYFTDGDKQFVDYSVKQEVTEADALVNGERKTVESPVDNVIHWFKFYAEEGDTVTFRTNQAATLQVFSPEGKELYSAQGSTAVKYGGCHTWVDGTYYVALHDVTGSKPNISLDFSHLAKYDVVSYDVATVGNGGCSTITFKGNGFKDLYAVDFISAANDSIHSFSIGHESDGTTSVIADFTDAEQGKYTALFHFTEGKKYVYDAITVEEAKAIELATEVTFPRSFGHVVTYTCKITNNGNMTAYAVPIYTWMKSKRLDGIYHIEYDGLDLAKVFDDIETDSLTADEIAELQAYSKAAGDDHHFFKFWAEDEDHPGDSVFVRSNYFFTNIAPYETKTLRLTISLREVDAYAYFTVPEDWPNYSLGQKVEYARRLRTHFKSSEQKSGYCCIADKIDCVLSTASFWLDMASAVSFVFGPEVAAFINAADCSASVAGAVNKASRIIACGDEGSEDDLRGMVGNAAKSAISAAISCVAAKFSHMGNLKYLKEHSRYSNLGNGLSALVAYLDMQHPSDGDFSCFKDWTKHIPNCPRCTGCGDGGGSGGGSSHDPNKIYGYLAESGSKFMTDDVDKVNYRIEFENDTAFATRSAMVVEIRDTLDSKLFDLSSYAPTAIKIGEKSEYLDGEQNFVRTIDMRPEINGLVEVEGKYDAKKGIMTWLFTSIDPMTMEPTNDPMDGFLPVNTNGKGIGEVSYDISLKPNLAHSTKVNNRASIVFDINEPILTPTWTNIVDATAPESHVANVQMATDSTAAVRIEAADELSGPWRYDVYVQYGTGAWFKAAENVPIDTTATVKVYEGINHGFYVVVTDSAGNVEQKEAEREFTFEVFGSQMDTNTRIELAQGWNWISHNQQEPLSIDALKPATSRMQGQIEELFNDSQLGWMGDLEELLPTQMYKVQMDAPLTVQLSGRLFNAGFRSVPLYQGWNWLGYPVANTMSPAEALSKLEAEEGDVLIGQDGMTAYSEGQWTGTLTEMVPGQGYMYRSASDKNLFYNATAQASSRRMNAKLQVQNYELPEGWTVNKRKYPNVMGVIAQLWHENSVAEPDQWVLAAFCGDECRGIASMAGETLMMNVYGQGGELIVFRAKNIETGEVLTAAEQEDFRMDVVGTVQQPYQLHIGDASGIMSVEGNAWTENDVYDLQGRKVNGQAVKKGVYVVTDNEKTRTQKVVRK